MADAERELEQVKRERTAIQDQLEALQTELDLAAAFEARYAGAAANLARVHEQIAAIEEGLVSDDPAVRADAQLAQRGVVERLVAGVTIRTEPGGQRRPAWARITYLLGDASEVVTGRRCRSRRTGPGRSAPA
jgi:hypothetical protein